MENVEKERLWRVELSLTDEAGMLNQDLEDWLDDLACLINNGVKNVTWSDLGAINEGVFSELVAFVAGFNTKQSLLLNYWPFRVYKNFKPEYFSEIIIAVNGVGDYYPYYREGKNWDYFFNNLKLAVKEKPEIFYWKAELLPDGADYIWDLIKTVSECGLKKLEIITWQNQKLLDLGYWQNYEKTIKDFERQFSELKKYAQRSGLELKPSLPDCPVKNDFNRKTFWCSSELYLDCRGYIYPSRLLSSDIFLLGNLKKDGPYIFEKKPFHSFGNSTLNFMWQ
ncbi:MAG: hypothetical protein MUF50_04255 [Planctomycetes bacterium]|jgi:hypothetical protein|nr:hypothetical protein [Planctomycetota bacterium]